MEYPTIGEAYEYLYARINVPWGINESWAIGNDLVCFGPSTENPDDPYYVVFQNNFDSGDIETPFTAGQVITLHHATGGTVIEDGTSFVYTKP